MLNYSETSKIIYFTVMPLNSCGFTDQILQFSSFYKLGLSLGYQYIHTPFINKRSSWNIYNFLGFNNHFDQNIINFKIRNFFRFNKRYRYIHLEINDKFLKKKGITNFHELQDLVIKICAEDFSI